MFICDRTAASLRQVTPEGFLRLHARIGRAGVQTYTAREVGLPAGFAPDDAIRVYRPPEEVFDPLSMASFAGKPVTDEHPPEMVDAGNWRRYAIGHSGEGVAADGDHLATDLFIADAAAAARAQAGAELSNGYHADFLFEPGTTPAGEPYDAVQRNIRGNHIALVDGGRCGASCRIGGVTDAATGGPAEPAAGGDAAAALDPPRPIAGHVAAQDAACGCRDEQTADLDALVLARTEVIDLARRLIGPSFEAAGRPTPAIRRLVVERRLGAAAVQDRSDAHVAAAFDTLVAIERRANPLATHIAVGLADGAGGRDAALNARDRFLANAWKGDHAYGDL